MEKIRDLPCNSLDQAIDKLEQFKNFISRIDFSCFKLILDPIRVLFDIKTELHALETETSHSIIKGIELKPGQCQIRKEDVAPNKNRKYMEFKVMEITDLHSTILKYPTSSFHEITSNRLNKMYFDIESTTHDIKEFEIRQQILKFIRIILSLTWECSSIPIHIASAHGEI